MVMKTYITEKMKEEKDMTLLDTILVFLGIKTEAEIKEAQRRTEIIAALKEEIEQEKVQHIRDRVELVHLNNEVYQLETGGRHTEALNRACVVEMKKKCLRVSEHMLDKHRETLASLETGGELDKTVQACIITVILKKKQIRLSLHIC